MDGAMPIFVQRSPRPPSIRRPHLAMNQQKCVISKRGQNSISGTIGLLECPNNFTFIILFRISFATEMDGEEVFKVVPPPPSYYESQMADNHANNNNANNNNNNNSSLPIGQQQNVVVVGQSPQFLQYAANIGCHQGTINEERTNSNRQEIHATAETVEYYCCCGLCGIKKGAKIVAILGVLLNALVGIVQLQNFRNYRHLQIDTTFMCFTFIFAGILHLFVLVAQTLRNWKFYVFYLVSQGLFLSVCVFVSVWMLFSNGLSYGIFVMFPTTILNAYFYSVVFRACLASKKNARMNRPIQICRIF